MTDKEGWPGTTGLNEKDKKSAIKRDINYARIRQQQVATGEDPYSNFADAEGQREFDQAVVEQYGLED